MDKLKIIEEKAKIIVENVSNDPLGRYQLRYDFYQKYGDPVLKGKEGLGNSELAFITWEIKRGVLNSIDDSNPGSPWWRLVNSHFLYMATIAQLLKEFDLSFDNLPVPVQFWLDYIEEPNERTWYCAHNSSIISGYIEADSLAYSESVYEQNFMNIVLYRVLYAQSMVEGVSFGVLGEVFGNPRGDAVSIITDIETFYPSHYPLSKQDIKYVTHRSHNFMGLAEDVFDKVLILPHLSRLYRDAAKWNKFPAVEKFTKNDQPMYPIGKVL